MTDDDDSENRPPLTFRLLAESDKAACRRFRCGEDYIDTYLRSYALRDLNLGTCKTFVATVDNDIAGYVTTAPGSIAFAQTVVSKPRMPMHPVPILLLARMGRDLRYRGKGVGEELVAFALARAIRVRRDEGCMALTTDPLNEAAARFYKKLDFDVIPFADPQPDTRGRPPSMFLALFEVDVVDREI